MNPIRVETNSSIQTFLTCRKKYYYQYQMMIERAGKPLYFSIGEIWHIAMELHYGGKKLEVMNAIDIYFDSHDCADRGEEYYEEWEKSRILVKEMYLNYAKFYKLETKFEVVKLETPFSVAITDSFGNTNGWYRAGKIDGIVRHKGCLYLLEHKTASQISNQYVDSLRLSQQANGYLISAEKVMREPIYGIVFNIALKDYPKEPNVLKNGKLSVAKNQNTNVAKFKAAIQRLKLNEDDYSEYLQYLTENNKEYFRRVLVDFSDEEKRTFLNEQYRVIKDIESCEWPIDYYKNTGACYNRGTCTYWQICSSVNPEFEIAKDFQKKEKKHSEL